MKQKKKQNMQMVWLEIGLAVLLAIVLGVSGAWLTGRDTAKNSETGQKSDVKTEVQTEKIKDTQSDEQGEIKQATTQENETETADEPYPIMGSSQVTVEQMKGYFESAGVSYPSEALAKGGADTIETFCQMYYEEAVAEGVRPEVAFVQTMKETNWLQYGGDASIEQFNFAGLGTTGGGVPGNSYPDVRTGIRAQIQHLKAYATTDVLAQECVDDRYEYVTKGSAPYVEWLGQKENPQGCGWATDENYGYSIVEMIRKMEQLPSE